MAENDNAQERTESATPKRLEDARKKGQVPRSRELSAAAVMLVGSMALYWTGESIAQSFAAVMRSTLSSPFDLQYDGSQMSAALGSAFAQAFLACAPVLGAMFAVALLAPMSVSGWNFSSEALMPKFSKLNPMAGLQRMFSMGSLVELAKSFAKFGVVATVAIIVLRNDAQALYALGLESPTQAMGDAIRLCGRALLSLAAAMLLIAAIDVPYQLWQHAKQLRMSRQEIREEMKESDGSPEVKSKVRRLQQEAARRRMMMDVPKADVVVTNPTHFAVALRYDDKRMRAPTVVAKGVDEVAARIREVAAEHKVLIFEAPPLARVLYRNVDIGKEIPAALYRAVAQVLTYIYQLRAASKGLANMPVRPAIEVQE